MSAMMYQLKRRWRSAAQPGETLSPLDVVCQAAQQKSVHSLWSMPSDPRHVAAALFWRKLAAEIEAALARHSYAVGICQAL